MLLRSGRQKRSDVRHGGHERIVSKTRYVALLRGINVGGNNIIRMVDLRRCFEDMGFTGVVTYIQSGNVAFSAGRGSAKGVAEKIERVLSSTFDYQSKVAVLSAGQLERVVSEVPAGFGEDGSQYRYDVLFVRAPMTAQAALEQIPVEEGVDQAHAGTHAVYFRRLISRASESQLDKLARRPVSQHLTARNWNTTTKLLALARIA